MEFNNSFSVIIIEYSENRRVKTHFRTLIGSRFITKDNDHIFIFLLQKRL